MDQKCFIYNNQTKEVVWSGERNHAWYATFSQAAQ